MSIATAPNLRRPSVLPTGSSLLELQVDDTLMRWDMSAQALALDGEPDSFKPWLVSQMGLQLLPAYFDDIDTLLTEGRAWLLERGSPAAVRRVLGWLGYVQGVQLEEEGPYLHVDLGRVASAQELQHVALLVRDSIPLHVEFYRVYNGWDRRAVRLDGGQRLDKALLDTDSGVWVQTSTGELRASFAQRRQVMLAGHPRGRPMSGAEAARYTLAPTRTHLAYHHATDPAQRRRALRLDKDRIDAPNYIDLGRMGRGQSEHRISLLVRDGHPQHLAYYRIYLAWKRQALRLDQTQRMDKDLLDSGKNEWVQPAALALHSGHAALHQVQLPRRAAQPVGHALQTHGRQVQQRLLRGDAWWPAPWPDLSWTLQGDQTASAHHTSALASAAQDPQPSCTAHSLLQLPPGLGQPIGHTLQTHGRQMQQRLLRGDAWWPAPWPDLSWTLEGDQLATAHNAQTLPTAAQAPKAGQWHQSHGTHPARAAAGTGHTTGLGTALHGGDMPGPQASLAWVQITEPWPAAAWLRAIDSRATTTT